MKLSIIIPVFNEQDTVRSIIERVTSVPADKEIIVVDDFSDDGTREILGKMQNEKCKMQIHQNNLPQPKYGQGESYKDRA